MEEQGEEVVAAVVVAGGGGDDIERDEMLLVKGSVVVVAVVDTNGARDSFESRRDSDVVVVAVFKGVASPDEPDSRLAVEMMLDTRDSAGGGGC